MATGVNFTDQDKETELYKYTATRHDVATKHHERKEAEEFYDRNATYYDEFVEKGNCKMHSIGARELAKQLKEYNYSPNTKIADVGAGTGLVGKELNEIYDYNNLTAFDVSPGMLEEAKKKGAYNDFVLCDLHEDSMEEHRHKYDHAISIGCFVLGIVKPIALAKVASLVKPGGLVCISFREKNFDNEKAGYKPVLDELEAKGVWKEVSRVLDDYLDLGLDSGGGVSAYYIILQIC